MTKYIIAIGLLISTLASQALGKPPSWTFMFKTQAAGGSLAPTTSWYFDRDNVSRNGRILTAWVLMNFNDRPEVHIGTFHYHHFWSDKELIYVNCATHQIATAEDVNYSKPMAEGETHKYYYIALPVSPSSKHLHWYGPETDANNDKISAILCKDTGITYTPILDTPAIDRLTIRGTVTQMVMSPVRSGTLVVAVAPDTIPQKLGSSGIYTFSLKDPERPQNLGFFPLLDPTEIVLSPDGQMAYVLVPPRGGYPKDRQFYGVFILDLANPSEPRLLAHLTGLFWTMGLARGASTLFIQNFHSTWADGSTATSRIRAYRLDKGLPTTYCTVDLGTFLPDDLPFAYRFLHFIGSDYLGIDSRGHQLFVVDSTDPCRPHVLSTVFEQYRGFLAGWKNGRILLINGHDIISLTYATPRKTILLFRPPPGNLGFYALHVQGDGAVVTGLGANEIAVFEAGNSDCFHAVRSFHILNATTEPVVHHSIVYAGGKDFITVMGLAAGKTLAANAVLACERE